MAILGLAFIPVLFPLTGHAQTIHRSHFKIDKLSTRQSSTFTYVDGEITNNSKKEVSRVYIAVRWFDKNGKVVDNQSASVTDLAPGETLPFEAYAIKNPEAVRYNVTVETAVHLPK